MKEHPQNPPAPSPGPSDITLERIGGKTLLEWMDCIQCCDAKQDGFGCSEATRGHCAVAVEAIRARLTDYSLLKEQRDDAVVRAGRLQRDVARLEAEVERLNDELGNVTQLSIEWAKRAEKAEADYNEAMKEWREDILRLGKAEVDMGRLRAEVKRLAEQLKMCRLDEIGAEEALEKAEAELAAAKPAISFYKSLMNAKPVSGEEFLENILNRRAKSPEANIAKGEEATDEAK